LIGDSLFLAKQVFYTIGIASIAMLRHHPESTGRRDPLIHNLVRLRWFPRPDRDLQELRRRNLASCSATRSGRKAPSNVRR
jgi:hypothetical protein